METPGRSCGACSLCCTLLRVDEIGKLGGRPCPQQRLGDPAGGCAIHATRPGVCRAYRCLWLQGSLEEADRPDRLGAVLDLVTEGETPRLVLHEAAPGALERSPRLREIVELWRRTLPVRVIEPGEAMDPDRPFRVLLPGGEEQRVRGERVVVYRDGRRVGERRLPWLDRGLRRLVLAVRRRRLRLLHRDR
jgi:hypothetical protein